MRARPDFASTVEDVYRAAAEPETWPDALASIVDHAGGKGALFVRHDYASGDHFLLHARLRDDLVNPYLLIRAFGLTAAEARVAMLITSGLSTPQAADELRLSAATVRTHLARCFDKVGVRSQTALARIVAAFPSGAGQGGNAEYIKR